MTSAVLEQMTGEELLLLRILYGEGFIAAIDVELDHRATGGVGRSKIDTPACAPALAAEGTPMRAAA